MLKAVLMSVVLFAGLASASDRAVMEPYQLRHRSAEEIQALILQLLEPGEVAVPSGTTLILRATPTRLEELKAIVAQLDTRLRTLIITVLQGENLSAEELNAGAHLRIGGRIDDGSIQARIRGQLSQTEGDRVGQHTQTIRTLEGRPAFIDTGQIQPIRQRQVYPGRYPTIVDSTLMVEATTGFEVVPRLAGDEVVLEVLPWSASLRRHGTLQTQSAATIIRTGIGEWTEIGSSRQSSSERHRGLLSGGYRDQQSDLQILIKVDVAD